MPKMPTPLRFNNRKRHPLHRLPFVGPYPNPVIRRYTMSMWNVPLTGGYGGGCQTGNALALIYLNHRRQFESQVLAEIVLSMIKRHDEAKTTPAAADALHGQIVGFFAALEPFLRESIRHAPALDGLYPQKLLKKANAGLAFDEAAYLAHIETLRKEVGL